MPNDVARPSRDKTLMVVAETFSQRSTCSRLHVGAVFSKAGRILVTGYNGAPSGLPHCDHFCDCEDDEVEVKDAGKNAWGHQVKELVSVTGSDGQLHHPDCNSVQPCTIAEHAERNAIAWAARNGVALEGCEVHVTHMPCLPCAMSLINAGVERVTYMAPYRIQDGVVLLKNAGIEVARMDSWDLI